jgi:hypothetical protein
MTDTIFSDEHIGFVNIYRRENSIEYRTYSTEVFNSMEDALEDAENRNKAQYIATVEIKFTDKKDLS